ncbi:MAG: energy transducer TonB [Rhodocyclaceae bacterium]|jgi:protein TonB
MTSRCLLAPESFLPMPPRFLLVAYTASLLLHAAVLWGGALNDLLKPAPVRVLQASLRLPPVETPPAEPLVKNTLDRDESKAEEIPPAPEAKPPPEREPAPRAQPKPEKVDKRQVRAAQQKIAQHLYYPAEAVARGLEGEVRLILSLGEDGSINDVLVAASSGHTILDNAAIKAAYAMGRLSGVAGREMILPVIFRLQ